MSRRYERIPAWTLPPLLLLELLSQPLQLALLVPLLLLEPLLLLGRLDQLPLLLGRLDQLPLLLGLLAVRLPI